MGHIHPRKLKFVRESRNMSQAQLADASDVSQKQISRLEKSDEHESLNKCHGKTIQKLSSTLNVPEEELATPPEGDDERRAKNLGFKRISFFLSEQDRLNYRFLEERYGVKSLDILRAAPLLFLVTAEMSLAERREGLAAFEDALGCVPGEFLSHLGDVVIGLSNAEAAGLVEARSVKECDLSGKVIRDNEWSELYEGSGDLYVDYLERKVRELAPDAFGDEDEISGNFASLFVRLFETKIEELSDGNLLARLALERGDVRPRDIPKKLLANDQAKKRSEWLAERCSEDTQRANEKRMAELGSIGNVL